MVPVWRRVLTGDSRHGGGANLIIAHVCRTNDDSHGDELTEVRAVECDCELPTSPLRFSLLRGTVGERCRCHAEGNDDVGSQLTSGIAQVHN